MNNNISISFWDIELPFFHWIAALTALHAYPVLTIKSEDRDHELSKKVQRKERKKDYTRTQTRRQRV